MTKFVKMVAMTAEANDQEGTLGNLKNLIKLAESDGANDNALTGRMLDGNNFDTTLTVSLRWEVDPISGNPIEEQDYESLKQP